MAKLRTLFSLLALPLAACDGNDKGSADALVIIDAAPDAIAIDAPPDAPSYDFSCLNQPLPTTANANITLTGTVQAVTLNGITPSIVAADGVTVQGCKANSNCSGPNSLGTATSAADGSYTIGPVATMSLPLNGYLDATKAATHRRTLVFPASPLTADTMAPVLMFTNAAFGAVTNFLSITQNDAANGVVGIAVTDCANTPIAAGATLTIKQNSMDVAGTTTVDLGTLAAQAAGTYLVFNVPENAATEVGATYMGMTLRTHTVAVIKGVTTTTLVKPGP